MGLQLHSWVQKREGHRELERERERERASPNPDNQINKSIIMFVVFS